MSSSARSILMPVSEVWTWVWPLKTFKVQVEEAAPAAAAPRN